MRYRAVGRFSEVGRPMILDCNKGDVRKLEGCGGMPPTPPPPLPGKVWKIQPLRLFLVASESKLADQT